MPHDDRARLFPDYGAPEDAHGDDFENYRSHVLSLYDGSLYFTDSKLGEFFDHLRRRRVFDDAVIVVAADHGEAFWDHGPEAKALGLEHFQRRGVFGLGHGHTLFPELIRVPLIVSRRGIPKGRVVRQVRNLDIAPSLLSLAGVDDPEFAARGVPLLGPSGEAIRNFRLSGDLWGARCGKATHTEVIEACTGSGQLRFGNRLTLEVSAT